MKSRRSAFTLVETLIAMTLLAGALLVLGNAWSSSLNAIRKSRSLTTLSLLLQKKITEYEIKYKDKTDLPEEESGDFGDDFAPYTWKMQSRKIQLPDLAAALTARNGGADEKEIMIIKQLQELIEGAVKEVRVTVIWKIDNKTLDYSVATYFVDHNAVSLPGGGGTNQNNGTTTGSNPTGQPGS